METTKTFNRTIPLVLLLATLTTSCTELFDALNRGSKRVTLNNELNEPIGTILTTDSTIQSIRQIDLGGTPILQHFENTHIDGTKDTTTEMHGGLHYMNLTPQ